MESIEQILEARERRLTDRQQLVLDFIRRFISEEGKPPTLREIGRALGIRSTNGVSDHLRALERKGAVRRRDMISRGAVPVDWPTPSTAASTEEWRRENAVLRELLRRVDASFTQAPFLSAEAVMLLGDIRVALKGGPLP